MKTKVMVGLSGGVDSAIAAYLLKKEGYEVVGGFMRNWDAITNGDYLGNPTLNDPCCPQEADYEDAKKVAEILQIPLYRIDFIEEYWNEVFAYFLDEYKKGRTPNPDIFCNKYIKFDSFLQFARAQGCQYIATGHYAKKIVQNGHTYLKKAHDLSKDQTYFLSQINEEQIAACLFPLGDIDKIEVRTMAEELDLPIAHKKDSTGVCFIGERRFKQFLQNYFPAQRGDIVDIDSKKVIGQHDGVLYYTLGQRKGLGIGGIRGTSNHSWFVCGKNVEKNILYVADNPCNDALLTTKAVINRVNWIGEKPNLSFHVNVKFRYRQKDLGATIVRFQDDILELLFDAPYAAITPGQAAVFYDDDGVMLGGGIIDQNIK